MPPDGCEARNHGGNNTAGQEEGTWAGNTQLLHVCHEIYVELARHGHGDRDQVNRDFGPVPIVGCTADPIQLRQLFDVAPVQICLGANAHVEKDDADAPSWGGQEGGCGGLRIVKPATDVQQKGWMVVCFPGSHQETPYGT